MTFLDELLVLFRYLEELCPNGIVLLGFASRVPAWRLHPSGGAADLVIDGGEEVGIVLVEPCVQDRVGGLACVFSLHDGVEWVSGPGGGGNRVRLNRKKH